MRNLALVATVLLGCASKRPAQSDAPIAPPPDGLPACATYSATAAQAPAALLFVLDRTASMAQVGKWDAARSAIVQAIDDDAFDGVSLGLLAFPEPTSVPGPACIFNFPIYCAVAIDPQVPVADAGIAKSTAPSGPRHDIAAYLAATSPETDDESDSSPIYAALNGAYQMIASVTGVDRRAVVLITDGGGSCTSIADPARPAYVDNNGCSDWEEPPTMSGLISGAQTDAATPTETFVIGVPGSDSNGGQVGGYDTPPYSMRLALSTYAVAGSPSTVDPACDSSLTFSQAGGDPAHPCHVDLSNGQTFSSASLADALATIRGNALSCTYALPQLPDGQLIVPDEVNVDLTVDGVESTLPRRSNPADTCAATPCWDYDAQGQVELIGAACSSVKRATTASIVIYVGCTTIVL